MIVGHHGLTAAVVHEIDLALLAHDLVKVRVLGDDRQAREAMLAQACAGARLRTRATRRQGAGSWRPNPDRPKGAEGARCHPPVAAQEAVRPRTPVDPVRERRRAARTQPAPAGLRDQSRRRKS